MDVIEGTLRLGCPVVIPSVKWTGDAKTQVCKAYRLLYYSTLGLGVIKKRKDYGYPLHSQGSVCSDILPHCLGEQRVFGKHLRTSHDSVLHVVGM